MDKKEYAELVKKYTPKESKLKNAIVAFVVGGIIGFVGELFIDILVDCYSFERDVASMWLCITIILFGSLATALSFFDEWITKCKMGLILPTTGFSHSITSSALDYKKDGIITLGSNFFKLAGSVILYGVVSSFFLSILGVIIYG